MPIAAQDSRLLAQHYRENGFAIARAAYTGAELLALQEETRAQIEARADRTPEKDFLQKPMPDGRSQFFRIDWLTDAAKFIHNDSLLLAAAHPLVFGVISEIVGSQQTLSSTAMVFKDVGGGPEIELHRDDFPDRRRFHRNHIMVSADIYLDHTDESNGCLKVLPGSHRISDVREHVAANLDLPGLVDLPMEPGDVLFHDGGLLHGSAPTDEAASLRRVLYYVWQSPEWMAREGYIPGLRPPQSWVAESLRLTSHIFSERAARADLDSAPFAVPADWQKRVDGAALTLRPYPHWADDEFMQELRGMFHDSSGPEWG